MDIPGDEAVFLGCPGDSGFDLRNAVGDESGGAELEHDDHVRIDHDFGFDR